MRFSLLTGTAFLLPAFALAQQAPIAPGNLPACSQTALGSLPATGTPSGYIMRDDCTWGLLNLGAAVTGVLPPSHGGTGINGAAASAGQMLIGNGGGFSLGTLTAGSNVTISNQAGTVTISSSGGTVSPGGSSGQIEINQGGTAFGGLGTIGSGNVVLSNSPTIAAPTTTGSTTMGTPGTYAGTGPTNAISAFGDILNNQTISMPLTYGHQGAAVGQGLFTTLIGNNGTNVQAFENVDFSLTNSGSTSAELNHHFFIVNNGTMNNGEGVESSINNYGSIGGVVHFTLGSGYNQPGGTINQLSGFTSNFVNNSTVTNSIYEYDFIYSTGVGGVGGSGTGGIQHEYLLKNTAPSALFATLGSVVVGALSPFDSAPLSVEGAGTTAATKSFSIFDSTGTARKFEVADSGDVLMTGSLSMGGTVAAENGQINLYYATSNSQGIQLLLPTSMAGFYSLRLPTIIGSDTLATLGLNQTFSGSETFSGNLNVASGGALVLNGYVKGAGASNPILYYPTAPTIGAGWGTSPSIVNPNGTAFFQVNVGTGGSATSGVVTLSGASHAWQCNVDMDSGSYAANQTISLPTSTTSVTLYNYSRTTGAAQAWPASTVLSVSCLAG